MGFLAGFRFCQSHVGIVLLWDYTKSLSSEVLGAPAVQRGRLLRKQRETNGRRCLPPTTR